MPTPEEDLQQAADRGDLERTSRKQLNEQYQAQLAGLVDKRWIILQAVEIAKASPMSVDDFRQLCEFIQKFIS